MHTLRKAGAVFAASALTVGLLAAPLAQAAPTAPAASSATTSPDESRRVDRYPAPRIDWKPCTIGTEGVPGECATVQLPLDYDQPRSPLINIALTRIRARDPQRRIGSLFLNPGGPGASGAELPARFIGWAGDEVLDRFDVIGMDPRGTNGSTNTHCFPSTKVADRITGILTSMRFPVTRNEERTFTAAAGVLSISCSGPGREVASAVSTAQVARDMDVIRRALGDDRLSFLGFSYGTYLGQVYANMFPDRVRAIAIDGVVDPVAWVGTPQTAHIPMSVRMNSAPAASAALAETLRRCAEAGDACPLPDPEGSFARVAERLKEQPVTFEDPEQGSHQVTYQAFVATVLQSLYFEQGPELIPALVAILEKAQEQGPATASTRRAPLGSAYRQVSARVIESVPGYVNLSEVVPSVMCSDSRNPRHLSTWRQVAASEDERAPWFGRHWLWGSVYCAQSMWHAKDEDAYPGPFNKVTSSPLLVVGNLHDPATSYASAVSVSKLVPNSRLLTSTNWGHTAYGISACATAHMDRYLVDGTLPPAGTVCDDTRDPFER